MLNRDNSSRLDYPVKNAKQAANGSDLSVIHSGQIDIGIALTDEKGQIILWNHALVQRTGLTSEKVLGTRIWDVPFSLLPAEMQTLDALERIRAPFMEMLASNPSSVHIQNLNIEFFLQDGMRVTLVGTIRAIGTEKGNFLLYTYQQADPSSSAAELRASSNEKFRNVVEQALDGIVIMDEQETILEWNEGWEELLGIGQENAIGVKITNLIPELFQGTEWQSADLDESLHNQVLRQLNLVASTNLPRITEGVLKHKDGTRKWVHAVTFPIHAGNATFFATIARDLTVIKQTEERLQRYARQLDTLRIAGLEISAELSLDSLIWMIAPRAVELLNGTGMALYLHNPEKDFLELALSLGDNLPDLEKKVHRGEALAGLVWESSRSILLENFHTGRTNALQHSYWGKVAGTPIIYGNEFMGVVFVFSDQKFFESDLKILELFGTHAAAAIRNARLHQQLSQLAITDSLTGIYNRRHFFEMAEKEFHQAVRYKRAFSIIMFDLDLFKNVNDTFGHSQGDLVLRAVVRRCADVMREADILGRYGGEEFVIALPETGQPEALALAERLRQQLASKPVETDSTPVQVTASFGVATLEPTISNLMQLINRADMALYQVKQTGRNQVLEWKPLLSDGISTAGQQ
jgi:diguanylate cyclase (GGDEF)-like protein/PAS domain S-box-containing protein